MTQAHYRGQLNSFKEHLREKRVWLQLKNTHAMFGVSFPFFLSFLRMRSSV